MVLTLTGLAILTLLPAPSFAVDTGTGGSTICDTTLKGVRPEAEYEAETLPLPFIKFGGGLV